LHNELRNQENERAKGMSVYPEFSAADAQLRYFTLRFREYPNVRHLAKNAEK
jgi:hypothetical protein